MPAIDYGKQNPTGNMANPDGQNPMQQAGLLTGLMSQSAAMVPQQGQADPLQLQQQAATPSTQPGTSSVSDLGDYLAKSYGIPLGRQGLVNDQGQFTRMPTDANEAAKFNYIAQAIADQKNREQQAKSVAALQTEAGLVQSRGRGSLATLQSGTYRALAAQYSETQFVADDFSYFIQEDFLRRQEAMVDKMNRAAKKSKKGAMWGSIIGAAAGSVVPGIGTAAGFAIGGAIGGGMY